MSRLRRRTISVVAVMLLTTLGLSLSSLSSPVAHGQGPAFGLNPSPAQVALDGTVDVDVVITDVPETGLWAATVDLTFDSSRLEVVQLITGTFPCRPQGGCIVTQSIDNVGGTIHFDATLDDPATPVGGSGTLLTIRFRGKAIGTGSVAFQAAVLWGPGPTDNMDSTADGGEVAVSEATDTPQPTPTSESTATRTPAPTNTPHGTNTPAPTRTPKSTNTPKPTKTPKSTATPKPPMENPDPTKQAGVGAAGAQPTSSGGGLPSAGTGEMPQQIWRWFFLSGAVVLGLATWAFTFRFYARQKEHERFWHR